MKELLQRAEVGTPIDLNKELAAEYKAIVDKAVRVFGYIPALAADTEQKKKTERRVIVKEAFEKVGIKPFTDDSVRAYKEKMVRSNQNRIHNFLVKNEGASLALMIIGCIAGVVLTVAGLIVHFAPDSKGHHGTFLTLYIGLFLLFYGIFAASYRRKHGTMQLVPWWKQYLLNNSDNYRNEAYKNVIPAFALAHAIALREVLGKDAVFFVDQFEISHVETKNPDPFLAFNYHGESYYFDVWDEPKFEQRQTI